MFSSCLFSFFFSTVLQIPHQAINLTAVSLVSGSVFNLSGMKERSSRLASSHGLLHATFFPIFVFMCAVFWECELFRTCFIILQKSVCTCLSEVTKVNDETTQTLTSLSRKLLGPDNLFFCLKVFSTCVFQIFR